MSSIPALVLIATVAVVATVLGGIAVYAAMQSERRKRRAAVEADA